MQEICLKSAKEKTESLIKIIGKNIRKLRIDKKLTQNDIAFNSWVEPSYISAVERGSYKNITLLSLMKLSILFEVKPEDLFKEIVSYEN